jgi:Ca-activated chloride channel family protein
MRVNRFLTRFVFTMMYTRAFCLILTVVVVLHVLHSASPLSDTAGRNATVQDGQDIGNGEVIRVTSNLVSVPVTVVDRQGQYVPDLKQNDFRVYENGAEQTISHFSTVDRPFSVVLLIDTSGSTSPFLNQIKGAAKAFVEQLRPLDTVLPVTFHGEIKALTTTATNDPLALSAAIDQMQSGPIDLGTRLYDAVDFSLRLLKSESARKAIILFTDGENTWGRATMKGTLQEADESGNIIYTLQYGDAPPVKYLQQLAETTGGRYFKAGDVEAIRQSFSKVAEELHWQYVIGYYPKDSAEKGQERKIKVKVNRDRVAVRARRSYIYKPTTLARTNSVCC